MEKGEKTEIILEFLRNGINSGEWNNTLLPKELELAEKFGVARGTVRRAFEHLVAEGVVMRKKHFGTMLCSENEGNNCIASIMRSSGHFYGEIFKFLQKKVVESGYHLQSVDVYGQDKPKMRKHIRRSMNSLLSIPGANKFILDGYLFRNFPQVDEILKKNPVFFDYFDSSRPDGMTGVLIDYHEVGILGAKYLIENGCRHPLLIIGDSPLPSNRYSPEYFAVHKAKKIINGYSEVCGKMEWILICMYFLPRCAKNIYLNICMKFFLICRAVLKEFFVTVIFQWFMFSILPESADTSRNIR